MSRRSHVYRRVAIGNIEDDSNRSHFAWIRDLSTARRKLKKKREIKNPLGAVPKNRNLVDVSYPKAATKKDPPGTVQLLVAAAERLLEPPCVSDDEEPKPHKEPAGKGRMRFTVQRYDSVPTTDSPSTAGVDGAGDAGPGEYQAPPAESTPSSPGHNTHTPSSPEPVTPPSPRSTPIMLPRLQEKQPYSDMDFADSPSMDSLTSTLFGHGEDKERDAVALRGRLFARSRDQRRLVLKEGVCNISLGNVRRRRRRFLHDIFTTLLELRWRWHLVMFSCVFLLTWIFFAAIWYIILILHNDHRHVDEDDWTPCVAGVFDFVTALLFSIETQHTIGYGTRSMETKCPEAVVLLMIQSCTGVFFQSLMTGIIFAKLSRPKSRANTIRFSKNAVICQRDGRFCLLFRMADMRKSHIVSAVVRAVMVKNVITKEGEPLPLAQSMLKTEAENGGEDNSVYLLWPTTVIHWIDEDSPFWKMSAEEMLTERFEIVVFLEGTIESTGMTTQVRTSYLPTEILWGHRLAPLVTYQKENGQYRVDYTLFHSSIPVSIPECSPMEVANGENEGSVQKKVSHNLSYLGRLTQLRDGQRPSAASLAVPSSFTMGPGPIETPSKRSSVWRRQSLPKFPARNGSKKQNGNSPRSRSLRVRGKTALNGISKMLPTSKLADQKDEMKEPKTDLNESNSNADTSTQSKTDDQNRCMEVIEAESVA